MLIHTAYAYCHLYRWRIEICFYRGFFFFRCIILTSVCFHQDETCITRAQVVNLAWTAHDTASAGISWEGSAAREHQTGVSGSLLLFPVLPWRLSCNIMPISTCSKREEHIFSLCPTLGSVGDKPYLQQGVSSFKTISQWIYQAHWGICLSSTEITYAFVLKLQ